MPTVQLDENGNRVIIRHTGVPGPKGPGVPEGGDAGDYLVKKTGDDFDTEWQSPGTVTGFVMGPASSINEEIVVFDGATGKFIKSAGARLSDLATVSMLEGVTEEDFTTNLKASLEGMVAAFPDHFNHFRGVFANTTLLGAVSGPEAGDYAYVVTTPYFYDGTSWKDISEFVTLADGADIATAIYDDGADWDLADNFLFTGNYKALVDSHESLIQTINGSVSAVAAIRTTASDWVVVPADRTILFVPGAGITAILTLPLASLSVGRILVVKSLGDITAGVSVTPAGAETIDNVAGVHSLTYGQSVTLQSTGSGWIII